MATGPYARVLYGNPSLVDQQEGVGENEECCPDSADFVSHGSSIASNLSNGDSLPRIVDSVDTGWTDEMHSLYLNTMEATFVKKLYDKEYCAVDLCGQSAIEHEDQDPDSAESKLSYPSPFGFKVWQKGNWQRSPDFKMTQKTTSSNILQSPWVQHFRGLTDKSTMIEDVKHSSVFKNQAVDSAAKNDSCAIEDHGVYPCRLQSNYDIDYRNMELDLVEKKCTWAVAHPEGNGDDKSLTEKALAQNLSRSHDVFEEISNRKRIIKKRKAHLRLRSSSPKNQVYVFMASDVSS
eukprot:TRINITY_DN3108_c0_g1_i1.p1 TRINITY_DN3108_c0_g1~~TRINITY_DN3108_c0_g1_i1.p1  ORF type:complete len:292 (+),score=53.76 TRINITY_DN3108_c0_g1_i1:183-1058(+)